MDYSIFCIAALVAFFLIRRYQRSVGPQLFRPNKLVFSIVMYAVLVVLIGATTFTVGLGWLFDLLGLAAGGALAWYGLLHTRFETRNGQHYYIPNPYIGLAVFGLFVIRMGYRFLTMPSGMQSSNAAAGWGFGSSPLTLALFFLFMGYFACYNFGLLHKSRAALEGTSGS
ncbi:MAG: DUF1453 domain-containing protein [Meiothermus sp.]